MTHSSNKSCNGETQSLAGTSRTPLVRTHGGHLTGQVSQLARQVCSPAQGQTASQLCFTVPPHPLEEALPTDG